MDVIASVPTSVKVLAAVVASAVVVHQFYYAGGRNPYNRINLKGKTAIVTGGNTGIGYETALQLAKNGAEVVLACRDSQKTKDAVEAIKKSSSNPRISAEALNLDSLDSVRGFAKRWKDSGKPIHLLINNAGVMALPKRETTKDGFEMQFGVNHLGHFLLTNLLLDVIKTTALSGGPVRIVNVSSRAGTRGFIDWDDLMKQKEGSYDPLIVYNQSKLANVLFSLGLQSRLSESAPKSDIMVTSLHPGVVRTELARYFLQNNPILSFTLQTVLAPVVYTMMKSPFEGAQTTLYCATAPSKELVPGGYYQDCKYSRHPQDVTRDPEAVKKVRQMCFMLATDTARNSNSIDPQKFWAVSEKLVGLTA
ncbi:Retinol dehydrogenase 12 [Gonapodya sp. JEL0774]|nr:Retinol dehydrogenase 12 [Gonapodya sp. JEL0774]